MVGRINLEPCRGVHPFKDFGERQIALPQRHRYNMVQLLMRQSDGDRIPTANSLGKSRFLNLLEHRSQGPKVGPRGFEANIPSCSVAIITAQWPCLKTFGMGTYRVYPEPSRYGLMMSMRD